MWWRSTLIHCSLQYFKQCRRCDQPNTNAKREIPATPASFSNLRSKWPRLALFSVYITCRSKSPCLLCRLRWPPSWSTSVSPDLFISHLRCVLYTSKIMKTATSPSYSTCIVSKFRVGEFLDEKQIHMPWRCPSCYLFWHHSVLLSVRLSML